jgi:hypothetical protein
MTMSSFYDALAPSVVMIVFFSLFFGFLSLMRYLRYKETVALAERGLLRGQRELANGKDTLRWGIVTAAVGLALCIGLYPIGATGAGERYLFGFGPWMLVGLLPLFFGLGLVLVYVLTHHEPASTKHPARPEEPDQPAP